MILRASVLPPLVSNPQRISTNGTGNSITPPSSEFQTLKGSLQT
ncbi:MAG: hypothetical protein MjAS7_2005 [Metallosphaera javensis (ex Sakai et al. 2022)]|nr:MAG: hypothetical protein MjAS7_2005 [Metallosphaera javensis (ex Sakai et al. 2022)]